MKRLAGKAAETVTALAPRLLAWFGARRRDLPWRRARDPYQTWVSEIMLQQTQVQTVIPYFERFRRAFPTVERLASAALDEVLRHWAGLGYYSRARNLHRAAQIVAERHGGRFPESLEEALALPGIGRYSAGAILSIAYGARLPAIDGNATRVLARVLLVRGDLRSGKPKARVEALGAAAVPEDRPGDYNQALMELGSLVCLPKSPRCETCCLETICEAKRRGQQEAIPSPRARPEPRRLRLAVGVVKRRGRVLLAQRPASGVWGGLWQFPSVELRDGEVPEEALARHLATEFGVQAEVGEEIVRLRHGIMNQRIELTAYACRAVAGRARAKAHVGVKWVKPEELGEYAMPAPHRRVADRLT